METTQTTSEHALEIACDESGWEGSSFAAANSDVIAYASVRLDTEAAAECIRAMRGRSGRVKTPFGQGICACGTGGRTVFSCRQRRDGVGRLMPAAPKHAAIPAAASNWRTP